MDFGGYVVCKGMYSVQGKICTCIAYPTVPETGNEEFYEVGQDSLQSLYKHTDHLVIRSSI